MTSILFYLEIGPEWRRAESKDFRDPKHHQGLTWDFFNSRIAFTCARKIDHRNVVFTKEKDARIYQEALPKSYTTRLVKETKTVENCARGAICTSTCVEILS